MDIVTVDKLLHTRGSDRFEARLYEFLGSEESRASVPVLLQGLASNKFHLLIAVVACAELKIREAVPDLAPIALQAGPGRRDLRTAAISALTELQPMSSAIGVLLEVMEDRDPILAEDASILLEFADDPSIVPQLVRWLEPIMQTRRSQTRSRVAAEVMAYCHRVGSPATVKELDRVLDGAKLSKVEQLAASGEWQGHVRSGDFPEIDWPK